jgi:hypothetical protein
MMSQRFFRYDATELRTMGARLVDAITGSSRLATMASDPDAWTEVCLDWLASVAAERARVDAAPARPELTAELYAEIAWATPRTVVRRGPTSMSHLSAPSFAEAQPYGYAYWERALAIERLETLLAVQCEWGGGGRPGARYGRVMLAAADLASFDARAKAIVFTSDDEAEHRRVVEGLGKLRLASWDARPWLFIDIPWRRDFAEHPPRCGLLEG